MRELFNNFNDQAREKQLLIVQPSMVAMVYASNSKPGCFTGFTKVLNPAQKFDYLSFLAAHALPGPNSFITCILQRHGSAGPAQYLKLEKKTAISEIPGLQYGKASFVESADPANLDVNEVGGGHEEHH